MGKQLKDVGTLFLIIGIVCALGVLYVLTAGDTSLLGKFVSDNFFFITVGGLIALLIGVIVRSIGKSKEAKVSK